MEQQDVNSETVGDGETTIKVCIFCCKNILTEKVENHDYEDQSDQNMILRHFFNLLQRHFDLTSAAQFHVHGFNFSARKKNRINNSKWQRLIGDIDITCCHECFRVVQSFNQFYTEMKFLELKVNWRIEVLKKVVKFANRVPSRMNGFRDKYPDQVHAALLMNFRKSFVRKCSRHVKKTFPRVVIEKVVTKPKPVPQVNVNTTVNDSPDLNRLTVTSQLNEMQQGIVRDQQNQDPTISQATTTETTETNFLQVNENEKNHQQEARPFNELVCPIKLEPMEMDDVDPLEEMPEPGQGQECLEKVDEYQHHDDMKIFTNPISANCDMNEIFFGDVGMSMTTEIVARAGEDEDEFEPCETKPIILGTTSLQLQQSLIEKSPQCIPEDSSDNELGLAEPNDILVDIPPTKSTEEHDETTTTTSSSSSLSSASVERISRNPRFRTRFKCQRCKFCFTSAAKLQFHVNTEHENTEPNDAGDYSSSDQSDNSDDSEYETKSSVCSDDGDDNSSSSSDEEQNKNHSFIGHSLQKLKNPVQGTQLRVEPTRNVTITKPIPMVTILETSTSLPKQHPQNPPNPTEVIDVKFCNRCREHSNFRAEHLKYLHSQGLIELNPEEIKNLQLTYAHLKLHLGSDTYHNNNQAQLAGHKIQCPICKVQFDWKGENRVPLDHLINYHDLSRVVDASKIRTCPIKSCSAYFLKYSQLYHHLLEFHSSRLNSEFDVQQIKYKTSHAQLNQ